MRGGALALDVLLLLESEYMAIAWHLRRYWKQE